MAVEQRLQRIETSNRVGKVRRIGRGAIDVFVPTPISAYVRERRGDYPRNDLFTDRAYGWFLGSVVQVAPAILGGFIASGGSLRDGALLGSGGYVAGKAIELGNHIVERKVRENR